MLKCSGVRMSECLSASLHQLERKTINAKPPVQKQPRSGRPAAKQRRGSPGQGTLPASGSTPPPALGAKLPLPHERDESTHSTAPAPDAVIAQAKRDIDAGLVDTDMRATPGLDAERRSKLVPGPGGKPPGTTP